ncbi:S-adenosyl-methyltransferase [Flavobacterium salilacus subsp. salilacus]|uniref:FtsL-like putative cell division protein n=1 Tax=Flavobacterium TaxID=237 RepID=UPI001074BCFA|nr:MULTISPECIES: FtsL-like putative cell division protein [Flavobacterium]KAF2518104.1 S-adenosyl-methyltransferase [Flavobacterium salilacus subsp. salilacus]MBE1615587.1 S-adenosyl-methyltransferase [Flavobacterium sp. SaA2.13]NDI99383.1 S-adenosyl-methyltransferase [Flavobacterium salilacus subsp. altitudinum]
MKGGVYGLLKAKYLVDEGSMKNWSFIIFLVVIAMLMIANAHNYEQKIHRIEALKNEVKVLRSEFVDRRSELMELKMESTVARKMEQREIYPSSVPPKKIKVIKEEEKSTFSKLWQ